MLVIKFSLVPAEESDKRLDDLYGHLVYSTNS